MGSNNYKKKLSVIKNYASENNISEGQVNEVFKQCFCLLEDRTSKRILSVLKCLKLCSIICFIIISSSLVLYNHPKTHNVFLRNLQTFIYPGLRVLRKIAVPIITIYPTLTDWYDEWCLVENPYFHVNEMDCWPCSSANSVQNLTGSNITSLFNVGIPFIRTEKIQNVDMNKLFQIYIKYEDIFNIDAQKIISNQASYRTIRDVMLKRFDLQTVPNKTTHIKWRINRMTAGRKLRKIFSKLPGVPDWWNPSTEKFIFIDEPKAVHYNLPNPECANVIVQCTNGERLIELYPSPECKKKCQKLSILLSAQQSLWYNWWYWRPVSRSSDNATEISIMFLTSYC